MTGVQRLWLRLSKDKGLARELEVREAELRESEARFRTLADTAPIMIWISGTDKLCTFFNKGWLDFTGREMAQELGNGWAEGVHPDDYDRCLQMYVDSFDSRRSFSMTYRLRRRDGEYGWVLDNGAPYFSSDGAFRGYIGSAIDVTELKRAEERWRVVVDAAPGAMLILNSMGVIVQANAGVERLFGYQHEELTGCPVGMLIGERSRVECTGFLNGETLPGAVDARRELDGLQKGGTEIPIEVGLTRFQTSEGPFTLLVISDISARREKELAGIRQRKELARLSRGAMLGELFGALAHEFNQPLTAMLSNAQAARRLLAQKPVDVLELREAIEDIIADNHRTDDVMRRLRPLLDRSDVQIQPIHMNDLVGEVLSLMHSELLLHQVTTRLDLEPELEAVESDRTQLQQVLVNLISNACHAMADSPAGNRILIVRTSHYGPQGVCVTVADSGSGIPPAILNSIFEPFFTTQPQGTGLGLSLCRTIVASHGGKLWATNNPSGGASFHMVLPALAPHPSAVDSRVAAVPAPE